MDTLVVVYDKGAVHPTEVHRALSDVVEVVFVVAPSEDARRLLPLMEALGPVVPVDGDTGRAVSALRRAAPDGIVTFSEHTIRLTSALASALGLDYHDVGTTRRLTDKHAQRERVREAGVESTRFAAVTADSEVDPLLRAVGLPAVLKPACGGGSRDTYLVRAEEDLRRLLASMFDGAGSDRTLVLEELLVGRGGDDRIGDYVSVESAVVAGQVTHLALTGKFALAPPFRETGQFWPSLVPAEERDRVLEHVGRAVSALGVRSGITHTEVKLTDAGPRVIEVNGRLGGHLNELSRRATGRDLVRLAGLLALGHQVPVGQLSTDRVVWQYNHPAPRTACRLESVDGWQDVLSVPGVSQYTPYVRRGAELPGGVMTQPLDLVCGEGSSHEEMRQQLREVHRLLSFTFRFDGAVRRVPAPMLADL